MIAVGSQGENLIGSGEEHADMACADDFANGMGEAFGLGNGRNGVQCRDVAGMTECGGGAIGACLNAVTARVQVAGDQKRVNEVVVVEEDGWLDHKR